MPLRATTPGTVLYFHSLSGHVHVPVPTPRKDEVLLKVEASSLNAFDWKIKKGVARPILPRKFPYIPATDVAGEIIEVGSEVKNFKAGYNVVAILNHFGVGHYAVQLAKLGNSHVTATCGARNIEFVKSLGADEVLDYKTPDGAALKSPSGRKYDAVIQCATGIPWSTFEPNLAKNGKVIDLTPGPSAMLTFAWQKLTFSKKQLVPLLVIPKGENLVFLVKLLKEGKIKTLIDSKHLLGKAEDAWGKSADGHATGKIILEP
ncbi:hypothetical protein CICLE_v10023794mg [Citrus x clementina]|uniref:Enoyl reductase (ER) domain-containing protein n=1 Tax=Citrus clementina TaxID=85681 RepID=V4T917_CITCL|nr:hypothetical protein CICLE_v10023794mg [Citrus x clementina]